MKEMEEKITKTKILVGAPTYDFMKYCQDRFLQSVKEIDYPEYDILIVDNSEKEDYFNELLKIPKLKVIRDNPEKKKGFERVVSSRNKIIDYAIDNNYDYLLMLDSDIIVPENIIRDLLSCNKEAVSGIYYNPFNVGNSMKILPVAWMNITPEEFEEMRKIMNLPEGIKIKDLRRHMTEDEVNRGELIEVKYPSNGCFLIKRDIFLKARYGILNTNIRTSDDIYFFDEINSLGYKMYVLPRIKCEHLYSQKYELREGRLFHKSFT